MKYHDPVSRIDLFVAAALVVCGLNRRPTLDPDEQIHESWRMAQALIDYIDGEMDGNNPPSGGQ